MSADYKQHISFLFATFVRGHAFKTAGELSLFRHVVVNISFVLSKSSVQLPSLQVFMGTAYD